MGERESDDAVAQLRDLLGRHRHQRHEEDRRLEALAFRLRLASDFGCVPSLRGWCEQLLRDGDSTLLALRQGEIQRLEEERPALRGLVAFLERDGAPAGLVESWKEELEENERLLREAEHKLRRPLRGH